MEGLEVGDSDISKINDPTTTIITADSDVRENTASDKVENGPVHCDKSLEKTDTVTSDDVDITVTENPSQGENNSYNETDDHDPVSSDLNPSDDNKTHMMNVQSDAVHIHLVSETPNIEIDISETDPPNIEIDITETVPQSESVDNDADNLVLDKDSMLLGGSTGADFNYLDDGDSTYGDEDDDRTISPSSLLRQSLERRGPASDGETLKKRVGVEGADTTVSCSSSVSGSSVQSDSEETQPPDLEEKSDFEKRYQLGLIGSNDCEGGSSGPLLTVITPEGGKEDVFYEHRRQSIDIAYSLVSDATTAVDKRQLETHQEIICSHANQHFSTATMLQQHQQYEEAIPFYSKAIHLRPNMADYYVRRAECYVLLTDFQSAILNYKRACYLERNTADNFSRLAFLYFFQGQTLFDQGLFPEALEAFSRAAEMRPDVEGYQMRSIACLASLARHGECLALVNKRLEVEQENADLFIMRARLHDLFANPTMCYYDVCDALLIDPKLEEAVLLKKAMDTKASECHASAVHLALLGKHREAIQKLTVSIDMNPSIAMYHVLRGSMYRRLNDFDLAVDDFLITMDKTNHDETHSLYKDAQKQLILTYNDFSVECYLKGYYNEAIILLNKAIKAEKNEKGLYINRGDCFTKLNEYSFAMNDYMQALELCPNDWSVLSRISVIFNEFAIIDYLERRYYEADEKFTLAINNNPKIGQYYVSRSRVRYLLENLKGARMDILTALHVDPTHEEIIGLLARLFPGKNIADIKASPGFKTASFVLDQTMSNIAPSRDGNRTPSRSALPIRPVESSSPSPSAVISNRRQEGHTGSAPHSTKWPRQRWHGSRRLETPKQQRLTPILRHTPLQINTDEPASNIAMAARKRQLKQDIQQILDLPKDIHHPHPKITAVKPIVYGHWKNRSTCLKTNTAKKNTK